jgi:hypothetical protein
MAYTAEDFRKALDDVWSYVQSMTELLQTMQSTLQSLNRSSDSRHAAGIHGLESSGDSYSREVGIHQIPQIALDALKNEHIGKGTGAKET